MLSVTQERRQIKNRDDTYGRNCYVTYKDVHEN